MDYEKEIPFGAFDSELMHQEISIPEGFTATIEGNKIILAKTESEDEKMLREIKRYIKEQGNKPTGLPNGTAAVADMLAIKGETVDMAAEGGYRFVDPEQPWKSTHVFENCTAELLQKPLIRAGVAACEDEDMQTIRKRVADQLEHSVRPEEQRFENPHKHYLDMTTDYYKMKMDLLRQEDK